MDVLETVRASIKSFAAIRRFSELYSGLVVPVLVGILAAFQDDLIKTRPFVFWSLLAGLIVSAVALTLAGLGVKTAPEVYLEWQREKNTNSNIILAIKYSSLLEQEVLAMNSLVREYVAKRVADQTAFARAVQDICFGVVEEKAEFFGFELGEKWNFAVYWWDDEKKLLAPLWREKARNHPSTGNGRSWEEGEGHVGHAFKIKRTIITEDALAAGVIDLMDTGKTKPYDGDTYRSYISIPILARDATKRPYGVLVATSSKPGRYDLANSRVLTHAAVALATLAETAYDSP